MSYDIYPAEIVNGNQVNHFNDDWDDEVLNMNLANGNFYWLAEGLGLESGMGVVEIDVMFDKVMKLAIDNHYRDRLIALCFKAKGLGAKHIAFA
jgi:hypothetical protein